MKTFGLALLLSLTLLSPARADAPPFLDLGFEAPECAGGWYLGGRGYDSSVDGTVFHGGHQSLRLRYTDKKPWTEASGMFGVANEQFPVTAVAGHKIRYSGYIKTEGVANGFAGLWWRADGEKQGTTLAFDNMEGRGAHGTTDWTRFQIELEIPTGAKAIYFGALLGGDGTAWFDDLTVEIDGKPFTEGPPPAPAAPPTAEAVAWLKKHALPFSTPEAGHGFADLQPLKKVIGKARIVALGEATHGTREFFQMKHRLTEFLASQMGFTLFAIEANMPEAYKVNDYVLTGKGDPKELLKGMYFWTWNTQEVLDMIEWMRAFNQSGKGRIQFLGFDMQTPTVAEQIVSDFLSRADSPYAAEAAAAFAKVEALQPKNAAPVPEKPDPEAPRRAAEAVRGVLQHLEGKRGDYLAHTSATEVDWAIQNARVVLQSVEQITGTIGRDKSMADNVEWIVKQAPPDAKIVLWAHNYHVSRQDGAMGTYLSERFGKDMVVLGFAFGEGRYNARGSDGLKDYPAQGPVPGSVESYLHASGLPRFVLDLRGLPASSPAAAWLATPKPHRGAGAIAMKCGYGDTNLAKAFDALIWFDQTHPSVLLK